MGGLKGGVDDARRRVDESVLTLDTEFGRGRLRAKKAPLATCCTAVAVEAL